MARSKKESLKANKKKIKKLEDKSKKLGLKTSKKSSKSKKVDPKMSKKSSKYEKEDPKTFKKNLKRPFQDLEDQEVVINEKYFRQNQDSIKILPNPSSSLDKTVTSTLPGFQHTIAELLFDIVNNLNLK